MQTLVFDPGGFKGRLRACPFWGTWRALLCEEIFVQAPAGGDLEPEKSEYHFPERGGTSAPYELRLIAVSPRVQADTWSRQPDGKRL